MLSMLHPHSPDPERIIIFGTSFGGGHVIQLASLDKGIAAAISQCPFTSGRNSAKTLGLLPTMKLVSLVLRDYVGSFYSNEIVSIPLAGHPGEGRQRVRLFCEYSS